MLPSPDQTGQGGPPAPPGAAPPPSLATAPGQGSALGGSPVGLEGSPDPKAILMKAQQLLKSGAISMEQYQMIVAKLSGGAGPPGGPPGGPPPLSTTGVPGGGPPAPMGPPPQGPPPSPAWGQ